MFNTGLWTRRGSILPAIAPAIALVNVFIFNDTKTFYFIVMVNIKTSIDRFYIFVAILFENIIIIIIKQIVNNESV